MIRKLVLSALLVGALLPSALLPAARAEQPGDDDALGSWWTRPRIAERLNLTPQQRSRIDELVLRSGQRMIDARAAKQKAQLALAQQLNAEELDDRAIDRLAAQLADAQCALEREQVRVRIDIARVLDREQRLALRDVVLERRGNARERARDRRAR